MMAQGVRSRISALFDAARLLRANAVLMAQLKEIDTDPAFEEVRKLTDANLDAMLVTETQRGKDLDDKLSKLTAILSVALTISGVVTKTIADGLPASIGGSIVTLLLVLAMLCFFVGALIGFNGLRPRARYGYGAMYLNIIEKGGVEATMERRRAISRFQVANMVQQNFGSAAIDLIRSGVILFSVGIGSSVFVPPATKPEPADAVSQPVSPRDIASPDLGVVAPPSPPLEAAPSVPDLDQVEHEDQPAAALPVTGNPA